MNTHYDFNPKVAMTAAADAIRLGTGEKLDQPHPLAEALDLPAIAYAAGSIARPPNPDESRSQVMGRGMLTSDFSNALADGFRPRVMAAYNAQTSELRGFVADIELRDFKATDIPGVDADINLELQSEFAADHVMAGSGFLAAGARQAKLATLSRTIGISREAIINDVRGALGEIFAAVGGTAGRIQARIVASTLENPGLLDDGQPVFAPEYQNIISGALGFTWMREAMKLLRKQTTAAGLPADLRAHRLIVAPELEFEARQLIRDAGLDMSVSVLADLPETRWYLIADPAACPVVALLRLAGSSTALRVEPQRRQKILFDGTLVKVSIDTGCSLLRRTGIVKGGADL